MANPFKILVVIAVVAALALAAGFIYIVFVNPGNNGSLNLKDDSSASQDR